MVFLHWHRMRPTSVTTGLLVLTDRMSYAIFAVAVELLEDVYCETVAVLLSLGIRRWKLTTGGRL